MPATLEAVAITAGAGTNVGVDQVNQGGTNFQLQAVKLALGDNGSADGFASAAYPVPVDSGASAVTLYNLTLTSINTEYGQALPSICRRLSFQCRTAKDVRFAFVTGKVAGPTAPYFTLKAGSTYDSGPVHLASATIYFAAPSGAAGVIMEIEAWS